MWFSMARFGICFYFLVSILNANTLIAEEIPPTTYADIAPIINVKCVSCHRSIARGGGLNLEVFPFTSEIRGNDQVELVTRVLNRMREPRFPMPPGGGMAVADIELVQAWFDQGLLPVPAP